MPDDRAVTRYSVRRLNPFAGVLQVLESSVGRATTTDGVRWDLEIDTDKARVLGPLERDAAGRSFIRFGLWTEREGHVIAMSRKILKQDDELEHKAGQLIAEVRESGELLPFAPGDNEELWLLDAVEGRPLALLAVRVPGRPLATAEPRAWRCAVVGDRLTEQSRFPDAADLEAQVRERAGYNIRRRWISRRADGVGLDLETGESMPAALFPTMGVRRDWPDPAEVARVDAWQAWSAPALLTLPTLTDEERDALERSLHLQASAIERHVRLYPSVRSEKRIRAARVQARFVRAQGAADD